MYGETVDGIDGHRFESELSSLKRERGVEQDTTSPPTTSSASSHASRRSTRTRPAGRSPGRARAARRAVEAVFKSWDTPRAQVYRRAHEIPDDLGTAVNVVQMVFGNKGDTSATGVAFTRDPSTGAAGMFGEFLVNAQGEDVVAGIRTPVPLAEMEAVLPEAFEQFMDTARRLEEHYRDVQDVEFTIEEGTLYLLQTRTAKRTAAAALKAAVDMVDEGLITKEEAVARIDPGQLDQLLHPMLDPSAAIEVAAKGLNASPGAAVGAIVFDSTRPRRAGAAARA
jgi:pyruvate,orthophosphate dikinase